MKQIKASGFIRFLLWILIAISGMGLVISTIAVIFMQNQNFYDAKLTDIREEHYERYSNRYSAMILDYVINEKQDPVVYFADKNFKFGVVEADSYEELEKLDLNKKKVFITSNFGNEELDLKDLQVFQCAVDEGTTFAYDNPESLFGYYWIHNTGDYYRSYQIDDVYYETESGVFYCKANGCYYPMPNIMLHLYDDRTGDYQMVCMTYDSQLEGYRIVDNFFYRNPSEEYVSIFQIHCMEADVEAYVELLKKTTVFDFTMPGEYAIRAGVWKDCYLSNHVNDYDEIATELPMATDYSDSTEEAIYTYADYYIGDNIRHISFANYGVKDSQIVTDTNVKISADGYVRISKEVSDTKNYFVLSYLPDDLKTYYVDVLSSDLFVQFEHIIASAYAYRYEAIVAVLGCLLIYLIAFVTLCCMAGHRKGQEELCESWINKTPLELYAIAVVCIEVCALAVLNELSYSLEYVLNNVLLWILCGILVLIAGLVFTAAMLEIITRIKLRTLWKRTVCGYICRSTGGIVKRAWHFTRENTSLVTRVGIVSVLLCTAEFITILFIYEAGGVGVLLWLLLNGMLVLAANVVAWQLGKLKVAGEHVAAGDLNYKVDTTKMFWDFKQHGEHLNSIGDGLSVAVDERMKSEHFKTELITNVSHDIKTPLTSIINYVDLLQKEEIENENVTEYLEVLSRQSARLKKLLEDLLEASKASTGTLPVNFEVLEAGVFMVQTVGEFEEKTAAQQLELIIKKPEEPIYIKADGRHFWRVIDNLMNNICKYAQPGTRVYINLEATEREVMITFRNTSRYALNISSEELRERFVRGDSSRNTEGSGLGLSIAQSLMELMHGRFELVVDGDLFKVILAFERCKESE